MAESSIFWATDGTGDGTGTGYTATQLFTFFRGMFSHTANLGGVVPDTLNELVVAGTATPVTVASGNAVVYGIPYFNTASENVTIATPAVSTRVDRIVLRASWAAQTVRITRIAGTEGAGTPAMTQTAGTTWDVPLATVSITTGGVITVTDAREWLGIVGDLSIVAGKLAADSVIAGNIADNAVEAGNLADNAVTTADIADDAVTGAKIVEYAIDPRSHISSTNGIVVDPQNGSARGNDAVDLQTVRSGAGEVASGAASVIGGGENNSATADYATVSGGIGNDATQTGAAVGGGSTNLASGTYASIGGGSGNTSSSTSTTVAGGQNNDATATGSTVGGGDDNNATATYSFIPGGRQATANKIGQMAHASGRFAANGDAQRSVYVLRKSTTNNTPAELFTDGSAARMTIASDTTWFFEAQIVARRTDANDESAGYTITGVIDNNAGTTALVGSITKTVTGEDTAAWDVTAAADNTNDALVITVTGENSKTIYWVAAVFTVEVTG